MNTPVSYAIAKLLKEKGFEVNVRPKYYFDKSSHIGSYMYNANGELKLCTMPDVGLRNGWIDSPTIADVVMWLYKKHGIWIEIIETDLFQKYFFQLKRKDGTRLKDGDFDTPSEAYEAAFEYTLSPERRAF